MGKATFTRTKTNHPQPERLVAKIISLHRSYYIAGHGWDGGAVDDEAIMEISGEITSISKRHRKELGKPIEVSLVCARRYGDEKGDDSEKPFLLQVNLRKNQRSLMAYLPSEVFWALPGIVAGESDCCIEAVFQPTRFGSGALLSLWVGSLTQISVDFHLSQLHRGCCLGDPHLASN